MITDFDKLLAETSRATGVPVEDILGTSRKHETAMARHIVMALWTDDHTFQDTVRRCGKRCHNTAMYARERVLNRAGYDAEFATLVAGISRACQHKPEKPKQ